MKLLRLLLWPFSLLYILVTEVRNFFFNMGVLPAKQATIPVITVGNLNTGGTGKSPMVDYLLKLLTPQFSPASISRGYGRKSKGFLEVHTTGKVNQVGDEPLMLKQANPNTPVFVCEDRFAAIEKVIAGKRANVLVLDDAFQHRYVKAGIHILLTSYNDFFYNDYVLPAGNLREMRKNAARAQAVVVTKCPLNLSASEKQIILQNIKKYTQAHVFFAGLEYGHLIPLFSSSVLPTGQSKAIVVTGIAGAQSLLEFCKTVYQGVEHISFPDHYSYKHADFVSIAQKFNSFANPDKVIITTHKDVVKWLEASNESLDVLRLLPIFYQPINMVILDNPEGFNQYISNYVRANKSNG